MSLESPTKLRQDLLSVIETTPEADLPALIAIVRDFQERKKDLNPAEIQWQKAIDAINTQDKITLEERKTNISKLIGTLNADDDLIEQRQVLESISSLEGVSI